jgi:DNA adenine methylase
VKNRRSPLFYVGDKFKLVNQILPLCPQTIETYFEPFAGGGSLAMNMTANRVLLNDIDSNVAGLHAWLLAHESIDPLLKRLELEIKRFGLKASYLGDVVPDELKVLHPKTYFAVQNRDAYNEMRAEFNSAEGKCPELLYLLLIFGFNRMLRFNRGGDFNVPVGNVDFNTNVVEALRGYLDWKSATEVVISNQDFLTFIRAGEPSERDFVYVDPPYLITQSEYNKIWAESDESRLYGFLDDLDRAGVRWALSNVVTYKQSTNTVLEEWMSKYDVHFLKSNYISYHNNSDKKPGEVLVRNYGD